jgi:hypothetical protein
MKIISNSFKAIFQFFLSRSFLQAARAGGWRLAVAAE